MFPRTAVRLENGSILDHLDPDTLGLVIENDQAKKAASKWTIEQ